MNELKKLIIKDLNNFDYYYYQSDDNNVIERIGDEKIRIEKQIKFYNESFKDSLSDEPEITLFAKKYFDIPFSNTEKFALTQLIKTYSRELRNENLIVTEEELINLIKNS